MSTCNAMPAAPAGNLAPPWDDSALAGEPESLASPLGTAVIISCEHGGNEIPSPWRPLFDAQQSLLDSHRGYDAGAMVMAEAMATAFNATLVAAKVSRLLVDLNRSPNHPALHVDQIRNLPENQRRDIVDQYYRPYRNRVEMGVKELIASHGRVVHISCHSFTPVLDGEVRNTDIGLLYDPARNIEAGLCAHWKAALGASSPHLRVRRNYPYRGSNDGLTTWLRKQALPSAYIGIELELNQEFSAGPPSSWTALRASIIAALQSAMAVANL
jgi:predicted N-formylglutamate amidohydrolase